MRKWYPLCLVIAVIAVSAIAYPLLPERVPAHWNAHGQVDRYSSRAPVLIVMPLLILFVWGFSRVLPKIDPRGSNFEKMQGAYDLVIGAALTVLAVAHVAIVASMFGAPMVLPRVMPALIGAMLVVVGRALPRAKPNWFFGIRTPWTLSNDRVWERTHRIGGRLIVIAGIVGIVSSTLPFLIGFAAIGVAVFVAAGWSVIYSYVAWKQERSK